MAHPPAVPADSSSTKPVFYLEFLEEREEILRHKWLLSENAGGDVGFERALDDWVFHHRASWRRHRRGMREAALDS